MADTRTELRELVDRLPEDLAARLCEWLKREEREAAHDWWAVSAAAFDSLFDETEVEYTEDDIPPG